ncbi:HAD family hydrolase [Formosa haliotis]|uniref:HAD family hydrolase n=1 Tax=Formosa haliotis TaxID=1555194 RepID=UPI00082609F0|nr:HAD family hydrolase [Formosa haliotis]
MEVDYSKIKVVGFDADDTLWVNETYFRDAEAKFATLLSQYETINQIDQELFKMELKNLPLYGYGIKGFVLSMVEMALEISNNTVSNSTIKAILDIGKEMINKPVDLLADVELVLKSLAENYRLIVITKGDLLDQERKLKQSGLLQYFHHIEVVSDKKEENYSNLLNHLKIDPSEFLMVGNSLKSDVLPLVNINAQAIHIPFHTTWVHEQVTENEIQNKAYKTLNGLKDLLQLL